MTTNTNGSNLYQVLIENQVVTVNPQDIMYWGQLANGIYVNGGMYFSDFLTQIQSSVIPSYPLVVVTASSQQLAVGTRYYINRPSLVMLELPIAANVGDTIEVMNISNSFQISQSSGVNIRLANGITTTGTAGYITSSNVGDSIVLECTVANDFWQAKSSIGNFVVN